ncbi:MAG: lysostaphin resistance A-like protein [Synechococcaceae cyanobacterium]
MPNVAASVTADLTANVTASASPSAKGGPDAAANVTTDVAADSTADVTASARAKDTSKSSVSSSATSNATSNANATVSDKARAKANNTANVRANPSERPGSRSDGRQPYRPHWWGTLLYVPLLYGVGWLLSRPIGLLTPQLRPDQHDLIGAVLALSLLLLTLPWRLRQAWGCSTPWRRLGLAVAPAQGLKAFLNGLLSAMGLLAGSCAVLLLSGLARWQGELGLGSLLNALALLFGVGFAEELLFRAWLLGELKRQIGTGRAIALQAALFALVHPWLNLPPAQGLGMLLGLVLLGLALAQRRRADGGALWGAIGLHGGLVGGWFALTAGLLQVSDAAPAWLAGPGGANPNPIGGLLGWLGLAGLLWLGRAAKGSAIEPEG